jgi:hypothetical protein
MDVRRTVVAGVLAAFLGGCGPEGEDSAASPAEFGFQKSIEETLIEEGQAAYLRYCAGCHGEQGDGNGPAAGFFDPTPRNFRVADFKFSSTRSGQLPLDSDLRRTIKQGLRGSAMPPFDLLPDRTVDALIAYLKIFSPKWQERAPAKAIPIGEDPFRPDPDKSEPIARGELIYHGFATCWTCHPAYVSEDRINEYREAVRALVFEGFRENLHQSAAKPNTQGVVMYPPDFRRDFVRSGSGVEDLYRAIAAGITGTAMPTWVDSMSVPGRLEGDGPLVEPVDLWALAYYVQSLIAQRPAKLREGEIEIRQRVKKIYLDGLPPVAPVQEWDIEEEGLELEEAEFDEEEFEDEFED